MCTFQYNGRRSLIADERHKQQAAKGKWILMASPALPVATSALRANAHGVPRMLQRLYTACQSLDDHRPNGQQL